MVGINYPYDAGSTFFISCLLSRESQCDRTINLVWWDVYCEPYELGPLKPHKSKVNTPSEWLGVTSTLTLWFLDAYTLPVGDAFDGIYKLPSEDCASSCMASFPSWNLSSAFKKPFHGSGRPESLYSLSPTLTRTYIKIHAIHLPHVYQVQWTHQCCGLIWNSVGWSDG